MSNKKLSVGHKGVVNTVNAQWTTHLSPLLASILFPLQKVWQTSLDNLALACGGCNSYKYIKQEAVDPSSLGNVRLYHPRQDIWLEQFAWSEDSLEVIGITPTGRATINALNLNRSGVKNIRRLLIMARLHPPA